MTECHRCGACCMLFRLSDITPAEAHLLGWENVEANEAKLGAAGPTYTIRRVHRPGLPAWSGGDVCVFYDTDAGCTIHDTHKPALCRNYTCSAYHLLMAVAGVVCGLSEDAGTISNAAQYQLMREFLDSRPELRADPIPAFAPLPGEGEDG